MRCSALLLVTCWGVLVSVSASPAVEEAYRAVVELVSPGQQQLTADSLRSLFNMLENRVQCGEVSCEKCDLLEAVDQLISAITDARSKNGATNVTVGVAQFPVFAAGCLLYLSAPNLVCTAAKQGQWGDRTNAFIHKLTHTEEQPGHQHMDLNGLLVLIHDLHHHYKPLNTEAPQSCVTAGDIMAEVNASSPEQKQEAGAVMGRALFHALHGRCILSRALPNESFFLDYMMSFLGPENFTAMDLQVLMKSLNLGKETGHEHQDDEHVDHDHRGLRLRSRRDQRTRNSRNTTWDQLCFSPEELILIHELGANASSDMGRSGLARLSPALVQQVLSGACAITTDSHASDGLSMTERYLYATLANVVITLTALVGIVMLLCTSCTSAFQLVIQFCVSLAVGSLTGDALLHLLPMFLGLHLHSDDISGINHAHDDHEEGPPDYIYKMLVVVGGIYCFYLMETIFSLISNSHEHHHHEEESEPHPCDHGKVLEMYQQEKKREATRSTSELVSRDDGEGPLEKERSRRQRILPFMITIGDGIHNFADGLAMGAAFSLSWRSGLATSVAVFCHELPHELGDFAILLHSGVSVRRALLLNVGSAMFSFIGLYIALAVASDLATKQWIAAVTAGLFLYVGLADMLPTLVHISHKRPWLMFLLQNAGLLTGWGILLLLALFEEKISF
eukprot:XP_003969404.2 PREDICTED: zinc transporter ZIP4 [Takifugu rubripes]